MCFPASVIAQEKTIKNISIVNPFPPNHPISQGINQWITRLTSNDNGSLQFSIIYPRHVPSIMNDALRDGDIIIYYTGYNQQNMGAGFVDSHPSLLPSAQLAKIYWTMHQQYWHKLDNYNKNIVLGFAISPSQYIFLKKNITDLTQLQGMNIAYNSENTAHFLRQLGANPVPLLGSTQLISGVRANYIDGAILSSDTSNAHLITRDLPFGLRFHNGIGNAVFAIIMRESTFAQLSPAHQKSLQNGEIGIDIGEFWDKSVMQPEHIITIKTDKDDIWLSAQEKNFQKFYSEHMKKLDIKNYAKILSQWLGQN